MAQKWILITGGSRGIGRALVTGLAQSWNVVFTGRDEEAMNATLAECENSSHRVRGYACDGNDESRVAQLAQTLLAERGAPEAIIHNAGIARDGLHIRQNAALWREVLDTNVISMLNWNRVLLPAMLMQRRGSIVMMSSVSAVKGNVGQTAYAASKAAMSGIARSLALEIPAQKLEEMRQAIPLRRLGETHDVLQAVAFLIGEGSQYMTGQTLVLDGGLSA